MYSLYIDDSGSLHPKHENNFLVFGGFIIATEDTKRLKNNLKKVLSIIKEQELKSPWVETYFPPLIKKIEFIWPRGRKSDCFYVVIDKRELINKGCKFDKLVNCKIYAKAISLIAKFFFERFGPVIEVTFDRYYSESPKILSLLNLEYKFDSRVNYRYADSKQEHGLQIAHCVANTYLNYHERQLELPPFLKNTRRDYIQRISTDSNEIGKFTESLMVSWTTQ